MGDGSVGIVVPTVDKQAAPVEAEVELAAAEKELLCPICMQIIKDAFLTACGHSFCYIFIIAHLQNKSDCPCCAHFLTTSQFFPNFLLDKLLKKTFVCQSSKTASPLEQFHKSLEKGCDISIKELDNLLRFLSEKKNKLDQEEAEKNVKILLDFLHCLRKQKSTELIEVQNDLKYIKEDLNAVERHGMKLYRAREQYPGKLWMLSDDRMRGRSQVSSFGRHTSSVVCNSCDTQGVVASVNLRYKKEDKDSQVNPLGTHSKMFLWVYQLHNI